MNKISELQQRLTDIENSIDPSDTAEELYNTLIKAYYLSKDINQLYASMDSLVPDQQLILDKDKLEVDNKRLMIEVESLRKAAEASEELASKPVVADILCKDLKLHLDTTVEELVNTSTKASEETIKSLQSLIADKDNTINIQATSIADLESKLEDTTTTLKVEKTLVKKAEHAKDKYKNIVDSIAKLTKEDI